MAPAAQMQAKAPMKIAYLMVDDAPSRDFAGKVRFLRDRSVPAVFFCLGKDIAANEKPLVEAISAGFVIGNHAWSHGKFSDMPLLDCLKEIAIADKAVRDLYAKAGAARPANLFRFPYLDKGGHQNGGEYFNSPFGRMFMNKGNGAPLSASNGGIMAYTNLEKKQAIQDFLGVLGYAQPKFNGLSAEWYALDGLRADRDTIATYNTWEYAPGRLGLDAPAHIKDENGVLAHVVAQWTQNENGKHIIHIPLIHDRKDAHIDSSELFRKVVDMMLQIGVEFLLPRFA